MRLARGCLLLLAVLSWPSLAGGKVWLIDISGAIGPATSDHVVQHLEKAAENHVEAVILRMNTPGGLDKAMREIIREILSSPVPVISYVAPQGSRAASAGTYILYASHIAAMAPATNLGAATPVQIGGMPSLPEPDAKGDQEKDAKPAEPGENIPSSQQAMRNKVVNDATAYIRGLAELRGRNMDWAEKAVKEGVSLTASEALEKNVIDVIAADEQSLLDQVTGKVVNIAGSEVTLETAGAVVELIEPNWRSRFLGVITDPNVAYILLIIGFYGLVLEFSNPGMGAGGIIGGVCLLLGLYALQLLPISYSAFALLLLGLGLMIAEAFTPAFGMLGLGGLIAFIIGSIMLMDTELPGFQIALPIILAFAAVSFGLLVIVVNLLFKSRLKEVVTGVSTLEGKLAKVVRNEQGRLLVNIQGELWRASCDTPLALGETVKVAGVDGLTLKVQREDPR